MQIPMLHLNLPSAADRSLADNDQLEIWTWEPPRNNTLLIKKSLYSARFQVILAPECLPSVYCDFKAEDHEGPALIQFAPHDAFTVRPSAFQLPTWALIYLDLHLPINSTLSWPTI